MIFPEKFLPMTEITDWAIENSKRMHATQSPFESDQENRSRKDWAGWVEHAGFFEGVQAVWDYCDCEEHLPYTMLSNGKVVRLSRLLLNNFWIDPIGTYVSLTSGTLGSGNGYFTMTDYLNNGEVANDEQLKRIIGPFWGLPVLFREKDVSAFYERSARWEGSPSIPDHASVAQQIVHAFDGGTPITKADARKQFAPHMKHAEFLATWALAANQRPGLSKPGPRNSR